MSPEAAAPSANPEEQKKPVKLVGTVSVIEPLEQTKKQQRPILRLRLVDSHTQVERHVVAFDTIATDLAAPDTLLQEAEPITIFAWKHRNPIHIQGQERQVEEWYVQKAIVSGHVFEKPRKRKPS